jgi:hypothetical protein
MPGLAISHWITGCFFWKSVFLIGVLAFPLAPARGQEVPSPAPDSAQPASASDSVAQLHAFLEGGGNWAAIAEQPFAHHPLTQSQADEAKTRLITAWQESVCEARKAERRAETLTEGDLRLPFFVKVFGDAPGSGRSLFISLHGGGGAPAQVNDGQWQNQQRLYEPAEGVYVAPRAPTDTWNLWHQPHVDFFLDRLIDVMVITEQVDRNRVYLMGYSAGGDGVYQLAPRMADRWAAAAMMAGHPNDASPLSLRNLPFSLQVGGRDTAYNRHAIAADWEKQLDGLRQADPTGYEHFVKIYPEHGHWMQREDAVALPWMAKFRRDPVPSRVVWKQDDVTHPSFYWLAVDEANRQAGALVTAAIDGQQVWVESGDVAKVTVLLDDRLVDLDQPVSLVVNGHATQPIQLGRTMATLASTLSQRGDPELSFSASLDVTLP